MRGGISQQMCQILPVIEKNLKRKYILIPVLRIACADPDPQNLVNADPDP